MFVCLKSKYSDGYFELLKTGEVKKNNSVYKVDPSEIAFTKFQPKDIVKLIGTEKSVIWTNEIIGSIGQEFEIKDANWDRLRKMVFYSFYSIEGVLYEKDLKRVENRPKRKVKKSRRAAPVFRRAKPETEDLHDQGSGPSQQDGET